MKLKNEEHAIMFVSQRSCVETQRNESLWIFLSIAIGRYDMQKYKKRERKGTLSFKNKLGDLVSMFTINDPHISWKLNLQLPM